MLRLIPFLFLVLAARAEDWTLYRSGPFEVYTPGEERAARAALNTLEQMRHVLETRLSIGEARSVWPIRLVVFSDSRQHRPYVTGGLRQARDAWVAGVTTRGELPLSDCVRTLLEDNTRRMPPEIDRGLALLFSAFRAEGPRAFFGLPAAAGRSRDWARAHLLAATPEYAGRSRVFFVNLQQGAGWEMAARNAFQFGREQLEREVDKYLASAPQASIPVSGRPLNPDRDFRPEEVTPVQAALLRADLLQGEAAQAAYQAVLGSYPNQPQALEGLTRYAEAIQAGSASARCHYEHASGLKDREAARAALTEAARLNPRWHEPLFKMAELESQPAVKIPLLRQAAERYPRSPALWRALAEACGLAADTACEAQAWQAAEQAATDDAEKERLHAERRNAIRRRAELEEAERRRQADEEARKLEELRQKTLSNIRAAEERAAKSLPPREGGGQVVEWWDDPRPKRTASGLLERVDCLRGQVSLVIKTDDGPTVRLRIPEPSRVALMGGGDTTLGCGPQKPPRRIRAEYVPGQDPKANVAGEATLIEFR